MPTTLFTFKSAGYSNIIKEYQELGNSQKQLDSLVRNLAKGFQAQGQSTEQATQSAKDLIKAQGLTAESIAKINARNKEFVASLRKTNELLKGFVQGLGQASFQTLENSLSGLLGAVGSATLQFEKFDTTLTTLFGNSADADKAFSQIQEFAATTPFQLDEVVNAFIKLKNRGIDPTKETLQSLGDIAASQGKSLNQITEAVLDANTGEFERLKEFGIQAKKNGDLISLSFKGIQQTIENTPETIQETLISFSKLEGVAGGMEAQSKTLGGQLSNLQDTLTKIAVAFGNELIPVISEFVGELSKNGSSVEELAKTLGDQVVSGLQLLGSTLKFVADNSKLFEFALQVLIVRMVALKAASFFTILVELGGGLNAAAVASGSFSLALNGIVVAMKGLAAAALTALPLIIGISAAIAAVQFIKFIGESNDASDALEELANQSVASGNEFAKIGSKIKSYNTAIKEGAKLTQQQTEDAKQFLAISKAKVKALEDEAKTAQALADDAGSKGLEDQKQAALATVAGINTQIKALNNQNTELEKNLGFIQQKAGSEARANDETIKGSAASQRRTQALKSESEALKETIELEKERAKNRFDDNETKIKRTQDDQKEVRKETNDAAVTKIQEASTAKQTKLKEQSEASIAKLQEANTQALNFKKEEFERTTLAGIKAQSEAKIQGLQKAFESQQNAAKNVFAEDQRVAQANFNREQNQEKKAFEKALNEETKAFNKQASQEQKDFEKSLGGEQKAVDRQLQLEDPNANKTELEEKFRQEDKLAARRAELEAPIQAKKDAFEIAQQLKKDEFEAAQQLKKEGFETAQQLKKEGFETAQQLRKEEFETELANKKAVFEKTIIEPAKLASEKKIEEAKQAFEKNVLTPLKKEKEDELKKLKIETENEIKKQKIKDEDEIAKLKKKYAEEDKTAARKEEDEKTKRQREFNKEQKKAEDDANKALESIKSKSDTAQNTAADKQLKASENQLAAANRQPGSPPGRREGGTVTAGKAYTVGEVEPEIFIPKVSGTILNQKQIRENLIRFDSFPVKPIITADSSHHNEKELLKEISTLRKIVESRKPVIEIPTIFEGEKSNDNHSQFIKLQRSLIRGLF